MKVLIAAGGTGGHIYPGIAIAKEILRREPESEILFVGTARGLETKIVPDNGFQLVLIDSAGLKNVGFVKKVKGMMILPKSFIEARKILKEFSPDVVVGAGGYVTGPVLLTAHFLRFPTMVMDSNALPGFTNRRLARFVDKAALTFDDALPYFGKKGVVTGNPVRGEFFAIEDREIGETLNILVFGGSQGSRAINTAMTDALETLKRSGADIHIVHQTGDSDFETVKAAYAKLEWQNVEIRPYISNMVESFTRADVIICRAGATTCAEVAAAGKAAIMIPLPTAADDHQRKNAEALVKNGAARMILQSELSGELLANILSELSANKEKLASMGSAARAMSRPDAAETAVDLIDQLRKRK